MPLNLTSPHVSSDHFKTLLVHLPPTLARRFLVLPKLKPLMAMISRGAPAPVNGLGNVIVPVLGPVASLLNVPLVIPAALDA